MEIVAFQRAPDFRDWLAAHHATSEGIWLRIFKKTSGTATVTYAEALDQALCHGWIDGQRKPGDAVSYLVKFTPRRPRSAWSKINPQHVARLTQAGGMTPAGLAAVAAAQADGRWAAAYDSFSQTVPPADFLQALARHEAAHAFFATLSKTNVYSIVYRLQTAKQPATRARRMHKIIAMLAAGQTFHPQGKIKSAKIPAQAASPAEPAGAATKSSTRRVDILSPGAPCPPKLRAKADLR